MDVLETIATVWGAGKALMLRHHAIPDHHHRLPDCTRRDYRFRSPVSYGTHVLVPRGAIYASGIIVASPRQVRHFTAATSYPLYRPIMTELVADPTRTSTPWCTSTAKKASTSSALVQP